MSGGLVIQLPSTIKTPQSMISTIIIPEIYNKNNKYNNKKRGIKRKRSKFGENVDPNIQLAPNTKKTSINASTGKGGSFLFPKLYPSPKGFTRELPKKKNNTNVFLFQSKRKQSKYTRQQKINKYKNIVQKLMQPAKTTKLVLESKDILLYIFEFAHPVELLKYPTICKNWYNIMKGSTLLKRGREYSNDYTRYENLKHKENWFLCTNYLTFQKNIRKRMRRILFDWMTEVQIGYNGSRTICMDVWFRSIQFVDLILNKFIINRNQLQLVGAVAMLLANKYENAGGGFDVMSCVEITAQTYTSKQVERMEFDVLKLFGYCLNIPNALYFVTELTQPFHDKLTKQDIKYGHFLSMFCLHDYYIGTTIKKSILGATIACLLAYKTNNNYHKIVNNCRIPILELAVCAEHINTLFQKSTVDASIKDRYMRNFRSVFRFEMTKDYSFISKFCQDINSYLNF